MYVITFWSNLECPSGTGVPGQSVNKTTFSIISNMVGVLVHKLPNVMALFPCRKALLDE